MTSYSVTLALYSDPKGYTEFIPRQISEFMGEDQIWYIVRNKNGSGQVNRLTGKTWQYQPRACSSGPNTAPANQPARRALQ